MPPSLDWCDVKIINKKEELRFKLRIVNQSLAVLKFASQEYEHDTHEDHGQMVVHLTTAAAVAIAAVGVAVTPRMTCRRIGGGVLDRDRIGAALVTASAEPLGQQDRCLLGLRAPVSG